jgi:hypothetical protein
VIREAPTFRIRPWEELAKYHEHRTRDLSAAFGVVQEAMRRAHVASAGPEALESLAHRFARLTRRLGVSTPSDL